MDENNRPPISDLTSDQYIDAIDKGIIAPSTTGEAIGMQRFPEAGILQRLMRLFSGKKKKPVKQAKLKSMFLG